MESIKPSRELATPHPTPEWFSGPVFVQALNDKHDTSELEILAVVPPGEWHWHGATADHATCHLSIRPGGPSTWPPDVAMEDWDTYMEGVEDA
jgi:hypothetical protein